MSPRVKIEVADWAKVLTLAASLVIYAVSIRKDVDAQAATITRIEQKVDGLLIVNSQLAVLASRADENLRRIEALEGRVYHKR